MRPAFSAPIRFVSTLLTVVLFVTSIAPSRAFAEPEPSAVWGDPADQRTELDLRTYFEGCNNYIDKTLENWGCDNVVYRTLGTCGLKRDAGDRPTPLMMLGMTSETEASGDTPFSRQQIDEAYNDLTVEPFLRKLYRQSLVNSVVAYVRLLVQFELKHPKDYQIADQLCSQGAGCKGDTRDLITRVARLAIPDSESRATYTVEAAARTMNNEIGKANYYLSKLPQFKLDEKPTEALLTEYTKSFVRSAMSEGPMRLITIPSLYQKIGFLQTPKALNKDIIKEWPDPTTYPADALYIRMPVGYRLKLHGYVQPADILKAIPEGQQLIEELVGKLHDMMAERNTLDHASLQASVTELIGTNALAAHAVLMKNPELAPSACRAFRDFAVDRAKAHRKNRYKQNAALGVGVVLALSGAVVPFLAPAWIAAVYGVSAAVGIAIAAESWRDYNVADHKLDNNVAEVLTDNESPEIILTRIPEEIKRKKDGLQNALVNTGAALLSVAFVVQEILFAKQVADGVKAVTPVVGAALKQKEAIVGAKTLFAASKMSPLMLNTWSYVDFKEYVGTVIVFEEQPGSRIMVKGKVETYDETRHYVVLRVISRTGPGGQELQIDRPEIKMDLGLFRDTIRGFRTKA